MDGSDFVEITLNVATEPMPNKNMGDISEQEEAENMNRLTTRWVGKFSRKVTNEIMEMQSGHDMEVLQSKRIPNLMEMLSSSSDDDLKSCDNEKMRELMEKQFSSSVDDMPFCGNMAHMMYYELYEAAYDKNTDADRFVCVVEQLCEENNVDLATIVKQVTPIGDSLLHVVAEHGSEQVLCLIGFHYPELLYKRNMKGDTLLHVAARGKNLRAIDKILSLDEHFMTSESVESSHKVELLKLRKYGTASHKADDDEEEHEVDFIMSRNNYGMTALHEAVLSKDYFVVLFLLFAHKQSDLPAYWTWNNDFTCKSPMYLAVLIGDEDILYLLLRLIPIPSSKTVSNGDSPLHAALSERTKDLLKKIVDTRKELLYQRDKNDNTPLHYAAYSGYMEGVCIILETSPMIVFQRNSNGDFPIHLACRKGSFEVVKVLLQMWPHAGLWLNHKSQNVLHIAAMKGQTNMLKHLLKHPKIRDNMVNEKDVNGNTPLHLASRGLCLWTLLLLSQHEMIDVNITNNEGFTARDDVRMNCKHPMTRQEFLADAILENAGVSLKANMLATQHKTSTNKEWNVKDAANTLILLAILIATVTFTAGFTLPGGFYSSDGPIPKQKGLALLADQTLFKIFMAFNTIAMYSSTIGSVILLWVPLGDLRFAEGVYGLAKIFVYVALIAMPVAFLAAIRLIVSNNTLLADFVSVIGFISIFFIMFIRVLGVFPLRNRHPVFRQIAGLFIRIIIILFYGGSDIVVQAVGEVDAAGYESDSDGSHPSHRSHPSPGSHSSRQDPPSKFSRPVR